MFSALILALALASAQLNGEAKTHLNEISANGCFQQDQLLFQIRAQLYKQKTMVQNSTSDQESIFLLSA